MIPWAPPEMFPEHKNKNILWVPLGMAQNFFQYPPKYISLSVLIASSHVPEPCALKSICGVGSWLFLGFQSGPIFGIAGLNSSSTF